MIYVVLWYEGRPDGGWDYWNLQWPEVGVELTTDTESATTSFGIIR